jgi:hypothetical protein
MNPTLMLVILAVALAGHYVSQKLLLARGWQADDPTPQIKRLMLNGGVLMIVAVAALVVAEKPYGLIGILVFIEGAVCFAFARKLRKK